MNDCFHKLVRTHLGKLPFFRRSSGVVRSRENLRAFQESALSLCRDEWTKEISTGHDRICIFTSILLTRHLGGQAIHLVGYLSECTSL